MSTKRRDNPIRASLAAIEREIYRRFRGSTIVGTQEGPRPRIFECPYCFTTFRQRDAHNGSDIACCGEVGHVEDITYRGLE